MSTDVILAIGMICFGGWLAIHCPLAARREWRAGIGKGRSGGYARAEQPFLFWVTIVATAAAGLMGVFFVLFGIGLALALASTDL